MGEEVGVEGTRVAVRLPCPPTPWGLRVVVGSMVSQGSKGGLGLVLGLVLEDMVRARGRGKG